MIPVLTPGDGHDGVLDVRDASFDAFEGFEQPVYGNAELAQRPGVGIDYRDEAFECGVRVFFGALEMLDFDIQCPGDGFDFPGPGAGATDLPALVGGPVDADLLGHLGLRQVGVFAGGSQSPSELSLL